MTVRRHRESVPVPAVARRPAAGPRWPRRCRSSGGEAGRGDDSPRVLAGRGTQGPRGPPGRVLETPFAPPGGYPRDRWTTDPCGFRIEDRSWCESLIRYSGIVKRTYLRDKASRGITKVIPRLRNASAAAAAGVAGRQYRNR